MNKYFLFLLLFTPFILCKSQSIYLLKDKKYVKHWLSYDDCCVQEINSDFYKGLILDGCKLANNDATFMLRINGIIHLDTDSCMHYTFLPTMAEVNNFNKVIFNHHLELSLLTLTNATLMEKQYLCQYVGIVCNNRRFLLVSFQKDETSGKSKRIQRKNYELFKLIYSRVLYNKPIDSQKITNEGFIILYDMDNNSIISLL